MKLAAALALAALTPAAAAVVPLPAPPPAQSAAPSGFFIPLNLVEKIECGQFIGTGSRIDARTVLTAQHVVSTGSCKSDGAPAETIDNEPGHDLSTLRTSGPSGDRMAISCDGFVEGREYFAVGYAFGDQFVVQRLIGTKSRVRGDGPFNGLAILRGNTYPGMSGGPIVDTSGAIVGIVNAGPRSGYSLSLSRPLSDTYLCGKR